MTACCVTATPEIRPTMQKVLATNATRRAIVFFPIQFCELDIRNCSSFALCVFNLYPIRRQKTRNNTGTQFNYMSSTEVHQVINARSTNLSGQLVQLVDRSYVRCFKQIIWCCSFALHGAQSHTSTSHCPELEPARESNTFYLLYQGA